MVKIVVSKDGFDWYLYFDGDPDKPLHCQLDGKCKQTTKIMVSGGDLPTMDNSDTGCHQELRQVNLSTRSRTCVRDRIFVFRKADNMVAFHVSAFLFATSPGRWLSGCKSPSA